MLKRISNPKNFFDFQDGYDFPDYSTVLWTAFTIKSTLKAHLVKMFAIMTKCGYFLKVCVNWMILSSAWLKSLFDDEEVQRRHKLWEKQNMCQDS